jgi:hypothetical protein
MQRSFGSLAPVLLVLALLLPAADPAAAAPSADAIDAAIDRGVAWLLEEQRGDGTWGTRSQAVGHTALAAFTLLHAGVSDESPGRTGKAFRRAIAWIDRHGPGLTRAGDRDAGVYETSLLALIECTRGRAMETRLPRLVGILERAQAANGQWDYKLPRTARRSKAGDNSNSQFAVLALGAAVGEGAHVKTDVLAKAHAWWASAAQRDGGFGYSSGGSRASTSTGSMTAAGLASLAILDAALRRVLPCETRTRALTCLAEGFEVDKNFGPAQGGAGQRQRNAGRGWEHYFLWSVERAMVLAGHERLGAIDWYDAGATHLLATQKKDGSWRGEHPLYATCFALLFLTRAADPPRVFTPPDAPIGPVTPGEGTEVPAPVAPAAAVPDLGHLLASDAATTPRELQEAALRLGPASLLALARALDDPSPRTRQRANETLRALLGDDRVGQADRHPLARGRLRLWLRRHQARLEAKDGRFVLP